jgi:hypothetical protein
MSRISNSQVSQLCPKVDDKVKAFPGRSDQGRLAVSAVDTITRLGAYLNREEA